MWGWEGMGLFTRDLVNRREGEPWQSHNIPMSLAAQVLLPPQGRALEPTQP